MMGRDVQGQGYLEVDKEDMGMEVMVADGSLGGRVSAEWWAFLVAKDRRYIQLFVSGNS